MKNIALTATISAIVAAPLSAQAPAIQAQSLQAQSASAPRTVLPANTEIVLSMNEDLTTKGDNGEKGETFGLSVVHDVKLGDYVVIPKGSRGVGEVTWSTSKGAFGKSGKMEIELRYVEVGGQRVPVEGKYRQEGEGNTLATVGGVVLAGVFAGFITGKSARIPRGRELVARTKDAIPVDLPAGASMPASKPALTPAAAAPSTSPAN